MNCFGSSFKNKIDLNIASFMDVDPVVYEVACWRIFYNLPSGGEW